MAIGEDKEELVFDDEEDGEQPTNKGKAIFPVVGMVLMDRKIKFQFFKELMASLWRLVKGVSIKEIGEKRPGGGVKTSPTGGNKWLIEGSSNTCMRLPQRSDSQDTDKQGWKETTTGTGIGSIKEGNSVSPEEGSGEQKRRRNWEEKEQEDPAGEDMALDRQKGSVGGLVVVHLKFESFSYFFCCCFS
ncbi:unnamed protein product [Cuscuta epithymum]|uniref:Uncharacterized protein n=1 Tax=Cuscuta epithymum TaxID=186058 RepID=A0AAV0FK21_9ASTE|nr:unnamed protein product [Cuscuta epithymum]